MRKTSILALLILFAILLFGCGVDRTQTISSTKKPTAQDERIPASQVSTTEKEPSRMPSSSKAATQPDDLVKSTIKTLPALVTRVVDGDTVCVNLNGKKEKVRFIGVDTPESTKEIEPYGKEAAAYTKSHLKGRKVWLEKDVIERDKYGRLLAYVWFSSPKDDSEAEVQTKMFNAELLLEGYAQVMTIPPNVKYANLFVKLQQEARQAKKGLWGTVATASTPVSAPSSY